MLILQEVSQKREVADLDNTPNSSLLGMSDTGASVVGSDAEVAKHIDQQDATDNYPIGDEAQGQTGTGNNSGTARAGPSEAQNGGWTREMPIRDDHAERTALSFYHAWTRENRFHDADATSSAVASASAARYLVGAGLSSDVADRPLARTDDEETQFVRWFFEQRYREEMEQRYVAVVVAAYLEASQRDRVPADLMEEFREEAREVRGEPLPAEVEAALGEIHCRSRSDVLQS